MRRKTWTGLIHERRAATILLHLREVDRVTSDELEVMTGCKRRAFEAAAQHLSGSAFIHGLTGPRGGYKITHKGRQADFRDICLCFLRPQDEWMKPLIDRWQGISLEEVVKGQDMTRKINLTPTHVPAGGTYKN